jgi:hypothetical protein
MYCPTPSGLADSELSRRGFLRPSRGGDGRHSGGVFWARSDARHRQCNRGGEDQLSVDPDARIDRFGARLGIALDSTYGNGSQRRRSLSMDSITLPTRIPTAAAGEPRVETAPRSPWCPPEFCPPDSCTSGTLSPRNGHAWSVALRRDRVIAKQERASRADSLLNPAGHPRVADTPTIEPFRCWAPMEP